MKLYSIFLIALFACTSLYAQSQPTITFKVAGVANKKIGYIRPLEGKNFPGFPEEATLDANGELVLPNNEKVAGAYEFGYKKGYKLFVEPGRRYKITVDVANKENPVTIEAKDKEGQLALSNLRWEFSQTVAMRLYRQDSLFAGIKQKVLHSMDSCLQPFEQLYAQHKISKAFNEHARSTVKNYYASVLASSLYPRGSKMVYHKDSAGYDAAIQYSRKGSFFMYLTILRCGISVLSLSFFF